MKAPENLKYSTTDEWVSVEGNVATLGVSDYAQDQLSDVVFVEITAGEGETVAKGTIVATIESVKAAADVTIPVSGKIISVNEGLSSTPELINSDPFGAAWMLKVELSDPKELDALMDAKAYTGYCETRSH
jgi:glycine cleavage system H protein